MTAQPRIALDGLTSDALDQLYDERDQYRADCQKWADVVVASEKVRRTEARDADRYEAGLRQRITHLEAEVARLTAGQCLDQPTGLCGCGRPDPGPCQPCPSGTPSLHCACVCQPADATT